MRIAIMILFSIFSIHARSAIESGRYQVSAHCGNGREPHTRIVQGQLMIESGKITAGRITTLDSNNVRCVVQGMGEVRSDVMNLTITGLKCNNGFSFNPSYPVEFSRSRDSMTFSTRALDYCGSGQMVMVRLEK